MVIFKLFMDIVKIGWVRVIYDGSGNFQVFSGFLWPKLRVPTVSKRPIVMYRRRPKILPLYLADSNREVLTN